MHSHHVDVNVRPYYTCHSLSFSPCHVSHITHPKIIEDSMISALLLNNFVVMDCVKMARGLDSFCWSRPSIWW